MIDQDTEKERIKFLEAKLVSRGIEIKTESQLEVCPVCEKEAKVSIYRLNTCYAEDSSNWMESCHDCYKDRVDYYNELWNEYYLSQGI